MLVAVAARFAVAVLGKKLVPSEAVEPDDRHASRRRAPGWERSQAWWSAATSAYRRRENVGQDHEGSSLASKTSSPSDFCKLTGKLPSVLLAYVGYSHYLTID